MSSAHSLAPLKSCVDDMIKSQGHGYVNYLDILERFVI